MNSDFEKLIDRIIEHLIQLREMEGDKTDFYRLSDEVIKILDEKLKLNSLLN